MDVSYGMTCLNSISLKVGQNLNVYEKYPASFGTNVDVVSPSERSRPHETQMEFGFK